MQSTASLHCEHTIKADVVGTVRWARSQCNSEILRINGHVLSRCAILEIHTQSEIGLFPADEESLYISDQSGVPFYLMEYSGATVGGEPVSGLGAACGT